MVVLGSDQHDRIGSGHAGAEPGVSGTLPVIVQAVLQQADVDELSADALTLVELLPDETCRVAAHPALAVGAQDDGNAERASFGQATSLTRGCGCNALQGREVPTGWGGIPWPMNQSFPVPISSPACR